MGQLQEIHGQLVEMGYQILFVSPDREEKLQGVLKGKKYDYTLLSDSSASASRAFGIAYHVDDETIVKFKKYGIDVEEASGQKHHLLPVPAIFVFNKKGTLVFSHVDPDYTQRLAPEVLLAVAKTTKK